MKAECLADFCLCICVYYLCAKLRFNKSTHQLIDKARYERFIFIHMYILYTPTFLLAIRIA